MNPRILYRDALGMVETSGLVGSVEALDAMVIPAKRALRLRHVGPYEELPAVHQRMHNWMWQQGMRDVGLNWEFYTHWSEDPAERVTDVYYALPKRQAPRSA